MISEVFGDSSPASNLGLLSSPLAPASRSASRLIKASFQLDMIFPGSFVSHLHRFRKAGRGESF
jgi:hypothetical protein